MKREILKLGKALTQAEQKTILGGVTTKKVGYCRTEMVECGEICADGTMSICIDQLG